jgi:hypothetical protein
MVGKAKDKKMDARQKHSGMTGSVTYEPVDDPILPEVNKTTQMLAIEAMYNGRDIRLIIRDLFNEHGSQFAVASELGLEQSTISIWALRLGIRFVSQPIAVINTL